MSDGLRFDERASRRLLASYQTADIVDQRQRVLAAVGPRPGERILDIGSGPGLLAGELAAAVAPGGSVHGVDVSDEMLAIARARAPAAEFRHAPATALPFGDASFEAVVCTQVYEYVPEIEAALAEARRVLAPGGRVVVLDTDWDSLVWRCTDNARMARVLEAWDEHLADPRLPRRLPELLGAAGFGEVSSACWALLNVGYGEDGFSAGLIELIATFVTGRRGLTAADAAAWAEDLRALGPGYFFSLNRYLFVAERSAP